MKPRADLNRPKLLILALFILGFSLLTGRSSAQVQTNTEINGTVSDVQGGVIPGAAITLKNQNTGAIQTGTSNGSGSYSFLSILPGTYTVTAAHSGFQTAEVTNRVAQVAEPAVVDFVLSVGQTSQTVTVSAAGADLIDTTTAEVSGTIGQQLVSSLPLNGGNFLDLVELTPGTTSTTALGTWSNNGSNQSSFSESALMRVNAAGLSVTGGVFLGGNSDTASNISIDGSNVQLAHEGQIVQLQSTSDIQEVKTESGVMNAEFGFGTGAVNTVTKSGTNQFHGETYEQLRNNALDATNYFDNLDGISNAHFTMNLFGASAGGPILKNKLHFFANYEGLRISQSAVNEAQTPPAGVRGGDFSSLSETIYNPYQYDPTTGLRVPFPNNTIPTGTTDLCYPQTTCMDPAMAAYLQYSPLPNRTIDGIAEYVNTTPTTITRNQYTGRIDWDASEKTRIFGRYTHFYNYSFSSGVAPIAGQENPFGSVNPEVSWAQILSPNAVNNLSVSYVRGVWANSRNTNGIGNISQELGLTNTSLQAGGPDISVSNGYDIVSSIYSLAHDLEDNIQFKDDLSLARGRHTFKFGFQMNSRRMHYDNDSYDKGQMSFEDIFTAACPLGNEACTAAMTATSLGSGGNAFADYLIGAAQMVRLSIPGATRDDDQNYFGGYAQNSWRISQKLTVNVGLRYDYWTPWLNVRGMAAHWDGTTGSVVYALQNPLDYLNASYGYGRSAPLNSGQNRAGYRSGNKDFGPRVGAAYLLTSNTTIRAGAGIYFDGNTNANQTTQVQSGVGPFGLALQNSVAGSEQLPPYLAYQQFPAPSPTAIAVPSLSSPVAVSILPANYSPTPTEYQWTASIQHRVGRDWVLEATYLGTHTLREPQYVDLNIPNQPLGALAAESLQQRRQFPDWGKVGTWWNVGFAHYNSLTTSIKTPRWNGLTLMSWFAYSRDLASYSLGNSSYGNLDFRHYGIWAGPSLLNPNFRQVNAWTYDLPVGKNRRFQLSGPFDWVAGEWQVSGAAQFAQGAHEAAFLGNDNTGQGQPYAMPDQVCNPRSVPGGRTRLEWMNTACFATPAYGEYGTAHLGAFIEPGVENWDLTVLKSFPIPKLESNRLQFQANFFNAWNHTQWGYVDNQADDDTFGQVEAAHQARQIQFVLKYMF